MTSEYSILEHPPRFGALLEAVQVDVVFGMPAKNCLYHGICKLDLKGRLGTKAGMKGHAGKATVFSTSTGQLLFRFFKNDLAPETVNKHFGSGYFIVLQPIVTPRTINQAIGIKPFTIQQGIYELMDKEVHFDILFS